MIANQRLLRKRQGGRVVVREICVHAPKVESVILSGNEQKLENYMLSGRDVGMIDFQTPLRQVQSHWNLPNSKYTLGLVEDCEPEPAKRRYRPSKRGYLESIGRMDAHSDNNSGNSNKKGRAAEIVLFVTAIAVYPATSKPNTPTNSNRVPKKGHGMAVHFL
jgi:hypothetical protein